MGRPVRGTNVGADSDGNIVGDSVTTGGGSMIGGGEMMGGAVKTGGGSSIGA